MSRSNLSGVSTSLRRAARRIVGGADQQPVALPADRPTGGGKAKAAGGGGKQAQAQRQALAAQWRLSRAVLGTDAIAPDVESFDPNDAVADLAVAEARRARGLAVFGDLIASGAPVDEAVTTAARELLRSDLRATVRALALGVGKRGESTAASVAVGLTLVDMGWLPQAWNFFSEAPVDDLARLVPVEAVSSALATGTPDAVAAAVDLGGRHASYDVATLVDLAGRFLVVGHRDVAAKLYTEARGRDEDEVPDSHRDAFDNLAAWINPPPAPAIAGTVVGVIDYHQPDYDHMSRNVGDYVQTLAMLGNLARFQDVRFEGAGGLGEVMTEVQRRVRPELRLELPAGEDQHPTVTLLPVSRDFSEGEDLPQDVWMPAFGWHMHTTFRLGFGLPYHPNVHPVFVSFHINRIKVLTPEAIEYLQAHGPIGCRDWTTVDLLLSAGVDAFFTGCLTTTVNAVFPELDDVDRSEAAVTAMVDLPPWRRRRVKGRTEVVTHGAVEHRRAGLAAGVRSAIDLLETYQRRYRKVITSRLHSYLPATSLGLDTKFYPNDQGDVRFDGLYGITPGSTELTQMQDRIRELLADTFGQVFAGADTETVRAGWRERTAPLVDQARARLAAPSTLEPPPFDLPAMVAQVVADTSSHGSADDRPGHVDIALSTDENLASILPVTVGSLLANTDAPVRLWITARGLGPAYRAWFSDLFPDVRVTFLGMDHVDYGAIGRLIPHTSIATMDRLLLPEILADLDRITYVDIDTVVEGDVAELAAVDLGGHPLAARTALRSGADMWRTAGRKLEPKVAFELRRTMAARHPFDFTTFNAGVLVLDLARMRADRFCTDQVPLLAGRFGLNDQDILNAYVGADRAELSPRWNALPVLERVTGGGIVHFAGSGKPWNPELVAEGERWHPYARNIAERVGVDGDRVTQAYLLGQGLI